MDISRRIRLVVLAVAVGVATAGCSLDRGSDGSGHVLDQWTPAHDPTAEATTLAFILQQTVLAGDWGTARIQLSMDQATSATVQRVLEKLPPLVDVDRDDLEPQIAAEAPTVRVPLRTEDGPTGVALIMGTTADGAPSLLGTVGPEPTRSPTAWVTEDGRLRRAYFVGSPELRLARLLVAFPKDEYGLPRTDGGPRGDLVGVWSADAAINADGLEGFYGDQVGNLAPRFPAIARTIGARKKAAIVEQANAGFTASALGDEQARLLETTRMTDVLDDATRRYDEAHEELADLIVAYVTHHPDPFLA